MLLIPEEEYNEKVNWLKHASEPWHTVVQYWEDTAHRRLEEFHADDSGCTVSSAFVKWPILKHPLGYTLVSMLQQFIYKISCIIRLGRHLSWLSEKLITNNIITVYY